MIKVVLIMAGGKSSRFGFSEKAFLKICNKFMIEHVLELAKKLSKFVVISISKNTPKTLEWCKRNNLDCIYTSGIEYSIDLQMLINIIKKKPILVLPIDLPFLRIETMKEFLQEATSIRKPVITLCVDKDFFLKYQNLNSVAEEVKNLDCIPIGISLINDLGFEWYNIIMNKFPDFLNINTWSDVIIAERICKEEFRV